MRTVYRFDKTLVLKIPLLWKAFLQKNLFSNYDFLKVFYCYVMCFIFPSKIVTLYYSLSHNPLLTRLRCWVSDLRLKQLLILRDNIDSVQ